MTQQHHAGRMPTRRTLSAIAILAVACLAAGTTSAQRRPGSTAKTVYCWNDGSGKRVCGDALPPEATDRARTEINAATGMRRRQLDRALTGEERAAAEAAAEAEARQAAADAARLRRELAMVESYATEGELRAAFVNRIEMTDGAIRASLAGIANLRQGLVTLLRQAGELELAGRPVPKPMGEKIVERHGSLERQQAILRSQVAERATLDAVLEDAVERYRELKRTQAGPVGRTRGGTTG